MIGGPLASSPLGSDLVKVALDGVIETAAIASAATVTYDRIGSVRLTVAISIGASVTYGRPWRPSDGNTETWADAAANDETWTPAAANSETWAKA